MLARRPSHTPPPLFPKTLSADDVLAALTDAGFDELAAPLRDSLAAAAAERAAAADATKKRKAEESAAAAAVGGEEGGD